MKSRSLATVRSRFAVLLLTAAVPLFVAGAAIAYQNARMVADRNTDAVATTRDAIRARQQSFLADAERLLSALAASPLLPGEDPASCSAALGRLLALPGDRYVALGVLDAQDRVRCGAGPIADAGALPAQARASGSLTVGEVAEQPGGLVALPVALAIPGPAGGTLLASLNEQRLLLDSPALAGRPGLQAWLLLAHRPPIRLAGSTDQALPIAADMIRLGAAADRLTHGAGRDGRPYTFATADLPAGMRVLVAEATADSRSAADMVLGRRLAELGLVLLAGLAVVAIGADRSVGQPLKQVARAMARWRAGGAFEPGPLHRAPIEIVALVESFSEATAALGVRERQLRAAAAHQELLMQEIHHRVKNNLQVVASLLNLQASRIRQPEARAEFHAARDRIRALATLHRHLYAHGELHTINMRSFLEELCEQLLQAMGETPAGGRIALAIDAPELRISSDQAVPMALLVTEAVSNAVKYAFPGGRSGHVAVRLTVGRDAAGQETARLSIDDDGVGIPAGRAQTDAGVRDGLGLQLIRGFAGQLGAVLKVTEESGTHYAVDMVLRRERAATEPEPEPEEALPLDPVKGVAFGIPSSATGSRAGPWDGLVGVPGPAGDARQQRGVDRRHPSGGARQHDRPA